MSASKNQKDSAAADVRRRILPARQEIRLHVGGYNGSVVRIDDTRFTLRRGKMKSP